MQAEAPATTPPPAAGGATWPILGVLLLLLAPLIARVGPAERARWHAAAAARDMRNHQWDAADQRLDRAIELSEQPAWHVQRSQMLSQRGKIDEAVEALNQALRLLPLSESLLASRAELYLLLGRGADAVADMQAIVEQAKVQREALALNGLAYVRARARRELPQALKEVEESLRRLPGSPVPVLDTRGFIHYLLGNFKMARPDLDVAADAYRSEWEAWDLEREAERVPERWMAEDQDRVLRTQAAVVLSHRVLLLAAMGERSMAAAERDLIAELVAPLSEADRLLLEPEIDLALQFETAPTPARRPRPPLEVLN